MNMKTWTYQVQDDVAGVLIEEVDDEREGDKENPYSGGFDEDPQDRLPVNKVRIILI